MERNTKEYFEAKAYVDTFGALRWKSNDRIPPQEVLDTAAELGVDFNMTECKVTRDIEDKEAILAYIEGRKNMSEEQKREEAYERRAAFGPGETVVNVLTGETFRT